MLCKFCAGVMCILFVKYMLTIIDSQWFLVSGFTPLDIRCVKVLNQIKSNQSFFSEQSIQVKENKYFNIYKYTYTLCSMLLQVYDHCPGMSGGNPMDYQGPPTPALY